MIVHKHPIQWYVDKLKAGEYFSQGMYGDGEWNAIFGTHLGRKTARGMIYTPELCQALRRSIKYRSESFLFSSPWTFAELDCLSHYGRSIDKLTDIEFVDKEVWDQAVRLGDLVPFIEQLQTMYTCIISHPRLKALEFLEYNYFIEIDDPNCFHQLDFVEWEAQNVGSDCVFLISAGLPAAIFAQRIHATVPNCWALDLGSIWDAFVRAGAQRGWRGELYQSEEKYQAWLGQYDSVMKPIIPGSH